MKCDHKILKIKNIRKKKKIQSKYVIYKFVQIRTSLKI
jgi:hypothetical protein